MKPSTNKNKTGREDTAALLLRISRDDGEAGDSGSIQNQQKLLTKAAKDMGYSNLLIYSDDGVSGTTMNRPGFTKMIKEIERGGIGAVFVKDLSRLGRNYREVGYYTEEFFPEHDVRFVALSDGVDSNDGEDDLGPFRNIMNEMYAKDISKKRRIVNKLKGNSGEPLSLPPYGYMKDPENSKRWIVDEEAAVTVHRIFRMTLEGYGIGEIATILGKDGILTPLNYYRSKGLNRGGRRNVETGPTAWGHAIIYKILTLQEYCGDVINFKTFSKSYRNKTRIVTDEKDRAIFWGVHEAIIDRGIWEKVQDMRGSRKKPATKSFERSIFSGLLKCSTCGKNLNFHFNQGNHDIKYFNCSNYNSGRGNCDSTHYIRVDFLEQVVLQEVHRLTKFADEYEDDFVKAIIGNSMQAAQTARAMKEKELTTLTARDKELDVLFEKIYEDNIAGKISDERFGKLSRGYEQEQGENVKRIKMLRLGLKKETGQLYTADSFLDIVRQYTDVQALTQRMVTELIDHIDVYHAEQICGERTQKVTIHYHCIGAFEVPDRESIPELEVYIRTRKGVAISCSNEKKAG